MPYESHVSRHTSEPLKKVVKILETRPQSSKSAETLTKNCKIHNVDKSILLFGFQKLFVFHPEPEHRKQKKISWDKTVIENVVSYLWTKIKILPWISFEKNVFLKSNLT